MRSFIGCLLLLLAVFEAVPPALRAEAGRGVSVQTAAVSTSVPIDRYISRLTTRSEHSMERFTTALQGAGLLWLWLLFSTALFLAVVAIASVVDLRMMNLREFNLHRFSGDVKHGIRMFFRLILDRRTPMRARLLLAVGLLYWLVPIDLIPDSPWLPGFMDDVVIAVLASKTFVYLCPDVILARHAHVVDNL
ncbi:MAG TPA: DUF1232 domain-containing protein [Candidatus Acidoferrales bacterium]|nr:DUF1232 domain-containing protein [Candidatus Acidoferrales bacterium]